jgi:hypothetical protein
VLGERQWQRQHLLEWYEQSFDPTGLSDIQLTTDRSGHGDRAGQSNGNERSKSEDGELHDCGIEDLACL